MIAPISSLPDSSRIWIFAADRQLTPSESTELSSIVDVYLADWKAHGAPVQAARDIRYNQFLIIAADPQVTAPSGCSIDDMTRAIKSLSAKFSVDFFTAMKVFYRDGDSIVTTDRPGFKSLARTGVVAPDTIVFDNSITMLSELRDGKWELAAGETWVARMFEGAMAVG